jgi:uncharacterized repeat protein (TIGR01451 family)
MKKAYLSILFLALIYFIVPLKAYADTSCQAIYGGGQTCVTTGNISINKSVLNPQTNQFVDNLNINDPHFQPGFLVTFKIAVTNTGNATISRINVIDAFPQYIAFSSGSGNFDSNARTLTFEVDKLAANETRNFTILGKVVDASQIPIDQSGTVCVVNQATATNKDNSSQVSQDYAQFCIEKQAQSKGGFPVVQTTPIVTVTPSTGAEALGLIPLIPTGLAGWFLRKKSLSKTTLKEDLK